MAPAEVGSDVTERRVTSRAEAREPRTPHGQMQGLREPRTRLVGLPSRSRPASEAPRPSPQATEAEQRR